MSNQHKPCFDQAVHVLLMHNVLLLFFSSSFFLYFTYTYSGFVTILTSSAVTSIEVSSGLRKSLIWKMLYNLLHAIIDFFSNIMLQVFKRENDLNQ